CVGREYGVLPPRQSCGILLHNVPLTRKHLALPRCGAGEIAVLCPAAPGLKNTDKSAYGRNLRHPEHATVGRAVAFHRRLLRQPAQAATDAALLRTIHRARRSLL